jgi:DNA uptake protein ComE-like DNA-binding protein
MARSKPSTGETAEWQIGGSRGSPSRPPAQPASLPELVAETSEWVISPGGATPSEKPPEPAPRPESEQEQEPERKRKREKKQRPEQEPKAVPAPEVARLRRRVAELEEALALERSRTNAAEQHAASAEQRAADAESRASEAEKGARNFPTRRVRASRGSAGPSTAGHTDVPDINLVAYEQLRALGLSVTESARVLAVRDVRGGFKDLDELDEVRGLPAERVKDLREHFHV